MQSVPLLLLRLNACDSGEWAQDLALLPQLPGQVALMCPRAGSAAPLAELAAFGLPLIESARGWASLAEIAAAQGAAVQLDGRMVDLPVVLRARRLLALAKA